MISQSERGICMKHLSGLLQSISQGITAILDCYESGVYIHYRFLISFQFLHTHTHTLIQIQDHLFDTRIYTVLKEENQEQ